MSIRESITKAINAEIDKWEKDIAALQAKADAEEANAEAQKEIFEKIDTVRDAISDARYRLRKVRETGEDAVEDLRDGFREKATRVRELMTR